MQIRRAVASDIPGINSLLDQVLMVHAEGRPDLFRAGTRKYTDAELEQILADEARPVFVAVEEGEVLAHAFCVLEDHTQSNNFQPIRTLYIDDICVDEAARGQGIATSVYRHVLDYARELGCHNVTLNVWSCNPGAEAFYRAMGMVPYKVGMEQVL